MKEYRQDPGGRRIKGDDFKTIQEIALLTEKHLSNYGNFVISGCEVNGSAIGSGIIMLDGKACSFGGAPQATFPYYVKKSVETENIAYESGTGTGIGYELYEAVEANASEYGALRLDTAKRFNEVFKPQHAGDADTIGKVALKGLLQQPQQIPAGADLNNYLTAGMYYCPENLDAQTISNMPTSNTAFSLLVEVNAGVKQTYTIYPTDNISTWVRSYYDGTWGSWYQTAMKDGSAVNADKVDGKHADDLVQKGEFGIGGNAKVLTNGTDPKTISKTGVYVITSPADKPTDAVNSTMIFEVHINGSYPVITARGTNGSDACKVWIKAKVSHSGGTWTGWIKANDGGNAATLEGKTTAELLRIDNALLSKRDFANGTLIQTSIDYSVSNGDAWLLEISGNAFANIYTRYTQVQGYIYSDTILHYGGFSIGTDFTDFVAFNYGGSLCFWFSRQSYWEGYNVKVYAVSSSTLENKVTAITDTAKPANISKQVDLKRYIKMIAFHGDAQPASGGTAAFANQLTTARTIWGQGFNGTGDIIGNMYSVGSISANGIISTTDTFSAGDAPQDNQHGYINITRSASVENASCFSWVKSGIIGFGLGYNSSNQIIMGKASTTKTIPTPWLTIANDQTTFPGKVNATGFYQSSDERLKDIKDEFNPTLEEISDVPLFYYSLKDQPEKMEIGTSAQKLLKKFPELVSQNQNGYYSVAYDKLAVLAIKGISLLKQELEHSNNLVKRIEEERQHTNSKISRLEKKLKVIENQLP